ncbi:hypothetical protein OB920_20385 [Halobacteria archaeon HArc-gm2]|nr:hypothetical protein [Halobacteria archaeon HArc-gm2]
MSEETARILNHARQRGVSSDEAWENVRELAEEFDWDVERMLSDTDTDSTAVSDRELSQ